MSKTEPQPANLDELRTLLVAFAASLSHRGVLPGSTDIAAELATIRPDSWTQTARGALISDHGDRDGVIVGLLPAASASLHPHANDWVALTCVAEQEGRSVILMFDREGLHALVNILNEAITESVRREAGVRA